MKQMLALFVLCSSLRAAALLARDACDPTQDKPAASYAEDIAKQIAEMKGEGKTAPPVAAPEAKKN